MVETFIVAKNHCQSLWWTGPNSVYGLTWLCLASAAPFSFVFIWFWLECRIIDLFQSSCILQSTQTFSSNRLLYKQKCQYDFRNCPFLSFQVKSSLSFQLHPQSISFAPCKHVCDLLLSETKLGDITWEPSYSYSSRVYAPLIFNVEICSYIFCLMVFHHNFMFDNEQPTIK